jgi:GxxExxY protein
MQASDQNEEELAHLIIGKSIEIHKQIGPGLDKSSYMECMKWELEQEGISFEFDIEYDVIYKNQVLTKTNSVDFIVAGILAINILTVEEIPESQVQRTLKIVRNHDLKLGLVVNFHASLLKNGIRRVSNNKTA